jgi:DNA modification methylase
LYSLKVGCGEALALAPTDFGDGPKRSDLRRRFYGARCRVHLIVTPLPYWNAVNYGDGQPPLTYGDYLDALDPVWSECERVLYPDGKLAIVTEMMPIPKAVIKQQIRHLKRIPYHIHDRFEAYTGLEFVDLFIWQKQEMRKWRPGVSPNRRPSLSASTGGAGSVEASR